MSREPSRAMRRASQRLYFAHLPPERIRALLQERKQLLRDELHVHRIRHSVQEVQRLALERLVRVLQAVDHRHLVLLGVLRVIAHDGRQPRHTYIPSRGAYTRARQYTCDAQDGLQGSDEMADHD